VVQLDYGCSEDNRCFAVKNKNKNRKKHCNSDFATKVSHRTTLLRKEHKIE